MTSLEEIIERIDEHLDPLLRKFKSFGGDMCTGMVPTPIVCIDGTRINIQASWSRNCTPKNGDGPWTHVQINDLKDDIFSEFKTYRNKVGKQYDNVPIELVAQVILDHGGIKDAI